jgi:uncharacterized protein
MSKRTSNFAKSVKRIADIQVTEWDFMELMHKDISELEISRSLRKVGNIRVMEWDFRSVLPAVNRLAHQEVDVVDLFKRAARYKVLEWDFRAGQPGAVQTGTERPHTSLVKRPGPEEMEAISERLRGFLGYVTLNLIDEPKHAQIKVLEVAPNVLRFKLVLVKRDVAMLIGREGHTAFAIRSVLRAAAEINGIQVLLQILSHEEEAESLCQ